MNLPEKQRNAAKKVIQSRWLGRLTAVRNGEPVENLLEGRIVYTDVPCHLSAIPDNPVQGAALEASVVFTLYVDTEILLREGDELTVVQRGQTFTGTAGKPLYQELSNVVQMKTVVTA